MKSPDRARPRRFVFVFPILAALGGCGVEGEGRAQPPERPVEALAAQGPAAPPAPSEGGATVRVERKALHVETPAVGSFHARQVSKLGTQVSGRVQDVLVDVGDIVKKNQELVRIDPTFFKIELEQRKADLDAVKARIESSRQSIKTSQADVEVAKAVLTDADLQLQRMRSLWDKPSGEAPSIPKRMFDEANTNQQQATARYESALSRLAEAQSKLGESLASQKQAEQAVKWAEQRMAETLVRAPYDGVVTDRMVDPGEPVTSTPVSHLLEVQDIGALELEFSLPQNMLSTVKKGTPVEYEVEGVENGHGEGPIAVVYPDVDETTRSFRCKVIVENAGFKFRPGLLVRVRVVREKPDALVVPAEALRRTAEGWQVLVIEGGKTVPRSVEVGLQTESQAEIVSGLKEGDTLVVSRGNQEG
jgi:multidrug efflux pump subunit AcrA (membrane-fusion protein)